MNRRINREKLYKEELVKQLQIDPYRKTVYTGITNLIRVRKLESAFDPYTEQKVLPSVPQVFALCRENKTSKVESYTNVSNQTIEIDNINGFNIITKKLVRGKLVLPPYAFAWIKKR